MTAADPGAYARQTIDHLPVRDGEVITELKRIQQHENTIVVARVVRADSGVERIRVALWIAKASMGQGRWTWVDAWAGTWLGALDSIEDEARGQITRRQRRTG